MPFEDLPVPYLQIDKEFTILSASREAKDLFPETTNFLDLIDLASVRKTVQFLNPKHPRAKLEVQMRTQAAPLTLFELRILWDAAERGHIVCVELDSRLQQVTEMMGKLRQRVAETDFDLLEQKEQLEITLGKMEQSALHNDKLAVLGELAAGIAHEIRNPLTIIRGFVQLLSPQLEELGKASYANVILTEIDRVNEIIHEFLSTAKPMEPIKQKISVTTLLNEVVLLCQSEALLKGCELSIQTHHSLPPVWVDPMQIKQVLLNIIKNALDAIDGSANKGRGTIRLEAMLSGTLVQILIHDNGTGIDARTLKKLFDPFFTTKETGTGLGLAVCKQIVQSHGGILEANSEVGVGTTFRLVFPTKAAVTS